MQEAGLPFLSAWQNFYVLMGTAAATLTGLMFVAITLMAGINRHFATLNAGISAFSTPALVHFGVVFLFSGIHNAWDLVTFLAVELSHPENETGK
jgi:hypothetical protein